jgi:hypothetical protein
MKEEEEKRESWLLVCFLFLSFFLSFSHSLSIKTKQVTQRDSCFVEIERD